MYVIGISSGIESHDALLFCLVMESNAQRLTEYFKNQFEHSPKSRTL
jgi:hypothetical protein